MRHLLLISFFLLFSSLSSADVIELKNGQTITSDSTIFLQGGILIQDSSDAKLYRMSEIKSINGKPANNELSEAEFQSKESPRNPFNSKTIENFYTPVLMRYALWHFITFLAYYLIILKLGLGLKWEILSVIPFFNLIAILKLTKIPKPWFPVALTGLVIFISAYLYFLPYLWAETAVAFIGFMFSGSTNGLMPLVIGAALLKMIILAGIFCCIAQTCGHKTWKGLLILIPWAEYFLPWYLALSTPNSEKKPPSII